MECRRAISMGKHPPSSGKTREVDERLNQILTAGPAKWDRGGVRAPSIQMLPAVVHARWHFPGKNATEPLRLFKEQNRNGCNRKPGSELVELRECNKTGLINRSIDSRESFDPLCCGFHSRPSKGCDTYEIGRRRSQLISCALRPAYAHKAARWSEFYRPKSAPSQSS